MFPHRTSVLRVGITLAALSLPVLMASRTHAQTLYYDRALFLADSSVTTTSDINFDSLGVNTNLTGQTIGNATFTAPGSGPLLVINAAAGIRFPMSASTGANVLSPGGSDPTLEDDDLTITFSTPVQAAGLDVVFDVPDGASYVSASFLDDAGNVIASDGFIPSPSGAPGYQFVGLTSLTANIKSIVFDEFDGSADDDNVAYDSLVYSSGAAAAPAVPEPGSVAMFAGMGVAGAGLLARRRYLRA